MKHIKELDSIIEMAIRCRLPKDIILFENKQQAKETEDYFNMFIPSGVTAPIWPDSDPEIHVDRLCYGKFIFHIIKTNFDPNE